VTLHGTQRFEEHGISCRRYNSRTTLTHFPFDERRNTFEAKPSDRVSAKERLRLVILEGFSRWW